jgi:hypothetical protein
MEKCCGLIHLGTRMTRGANNNSFNLCRRGAVAVFVVLLLCDELAEENLFRNDCCVLVIVFDCSLKIDGLSRGIGVSGIRNLLNDNAMRLLLFALVAPMLVTVDFVDSVILF